MIFDIPIASKESVLGVKKFIQERWTDITQCFDVTSEWFAKYCNLVERGLHSRDLQYGEEHHIVPYAWYKLQGYTGWRRAKAMNEHNVTVFTYGEHVYAHFCLAKCAIGEMIGKMAIAFTNLSGHPGNRIIIPEEQVLLNSITDIERERIHYADPRSAKVRAEGRTNRWVDAKKQSNERSKKWAHEHRAQCTASAKRYRDTHPEYRKRCSIRSMEYNKEHPEAYKARHKKWRTINKPKLAKWAKEWQANNKDKVKATAKRYRDNHLELHHARCKDWYETHKNAGYRLRKNKETGKREWVYVGIDYVTPTPKTKEEKTASRHEYKISHRDEISTYNKEYRAKNRDILNEKSRKKYHDNHDKSLAQAKQYRETHRDELNRKAREYRLNKIADGYKKLTNPITKKREWVFVGLPIEQIKKSA